MKKKNSLLIVYLISFVITWVCQIFLFDKNEFEFEFNEKETTTAEIYNIDTDEVIEELYDGRQTNVHEVKYIEYSYSVDGKNYKYGSEYTDGEFSISDIIEIEYLKKNPSFSKVKGLYNYRYNYFVRNLFSVSIISFLLMFFLVGVLKELNKWFEKK